MKCSTWFGRSGQHYLRLTLSIMMMVKKDEVRKSAKASSRGHVISIYSSSVRRPRPRKEVRAGKARLVEVMERGEHERCRNLAFV